MQVAVYGRPGSPAEPHTVTILYVVPVASCHQVTPQPASYGRRGYNSPLFLVQFHSLHTAMETNITHEQDRYIEVASYPLCIIIDLCREMLTSVSEWLHERHALPFLALSMLFLGGEEGGVVKRVIENPVFSCHIAPPEDQLVISLNNPTFPTGRSTLDLHATHA